MAAWPSLQGRNAPGRDRRAAERPSSALVHGPGSTPGAWPPATSTRWQRCATRARPGWRYHNRLLAAAGRGPATQWPPERFTEMLARERITDVVVATVDALHDHYIVPALEAGCRVVTEKPMTVDAARCESILDATSRTGNALDGRLQLPLQPGPRAGLAAAARPGHRGGALGALRVAARRAARRGLLPPLAPREEPQRRPDGAQGQPSLRPGELVAGQRAPGGVRLRPARLLRGGRRARGTGFGATTSGPTARPQAAGDPFALDLSGRQELRELYLDAEADSGYLRDRNVFDGDISIEDDMAVLVRYASGASMSYHLTAYSPWEGCRVMFNGSAGRLELEVVESRLAAAARRSGPAHQAPSTAKQPWPTPAGATIRLRRLWEPPAGHTRHHRPPRPRRRRRADADRAVRPAGHQRAAGTRASRTRSTGRADARSARRRPGAGGRGGGQRMLPHRAPSTDR